MAAVLKHWREAATLILVTSSKLARGASVRLTNAGNSSDRSNSQNGKQSQATDDFDVLILKRSSKSKFMPNLYVFPGGVAADSDFSGKWLTVFNKLGGDVRQKLFEQVSRGSSTAAPMFTRQRGPEFSAIPSDVAFRICAIRETFEESGVLLAQSVKTARNLASSASSSKNGSQSPALLQEDVSIIHEWRQRVNNNPDEFLTMCLELDLVPEVWSLYEWSDWLTPTREVQNLRRFDTAFYVCCVDHKPDAAEDAGETVNALWASPSSILTAFYKQKGGLAPPQLYELSRLLNFKSANDVLNHLAQPDRERVERWLPVTMMCKDYIMAVMPGDDLYPKEPEMESVDYFPVYEETLEELNKKYPNQHRTCALASSGAQRLNWQIHCSIPPRRKGHVNPNIEMFGSIKMKAKL